MKELGTCATCNLPFRWVVASGTKKKCATGHTADK